MTFHISYLLERAASNNANNGIVAYPLNDGSHPRKVTYEELHALATANGKLLREHLGCRNKLIVLIHFEDHLDNIIWLWSVIYAGYTPAMSTAFPREPHHCQKHLTHLKTLLDDPICLTKSSLLSQFPEPSILTVLDVASLEGAPITHLQAGPRTPSPDLALLMLTSGSTGNAKAVCITHQQISASLSGKASALPVNPKENISFMNWIRLDHVGSLVEIHMHALLVGVNQIHLQPEDIISNPMLFLDTIHQHRVARTFAPNFFLCELVRVLESGVPQSHLDLSCLRYIVSGGEANLVSTCVCISLLLNTLGAPKNAIIPAFGMTETCAGSIYNLSCPSYDVSQKHEIASVGQCVPGIRMRVTGEEGNLEISGPIVFNRYYNNEQDTIKSFTSDGWFMTGDTAVIDSDGRLSLSGRTKDLMSINGVKFLAAELQTAIEEDTIKGIQPGYVVCFSNRLPGAHTEQICVIYLPTYSPDDIEARYRTQAAITRSVLVFTGARPYVLPLEEKHLGRSTLGKLSGAKIRRSLDNGEYSAAEEHNAAQIKAYQDQIWSPPANETEEAIMQELEQVLDLPEKTIGMEATMFEMGLTSVALMKLKRRIEQRLQFKDIPLITMMKNPSVRALANALRQTHTPQEYDPVVTLNAQGSKSPLWLIHPGVGEILVFLGLAKFITDRPVYAMRARGFNEGETHFEDIAETVATYHTAIKAKQPQGPYALAGYSYGSMLAFEVAKTLESGGDEVRFVGAFNLPPHIKFRMRQLDWTECLLHLSFFLDIMTEEFSQSIREEITPLSQPEAIAYVMKVSDAARLAELSLDAEKLLRWTCLAYGLQSMARYYDPTGCVARMDVFYCHPLAVVASGKQQWLEEHLYPWREFVREDVRYHDVKGEHYTMLAPEHIRGFQATLRKALVARGL
ncbi:putative non-ribosomal peptide synthase-like protein [Aspergillus ellipticus CBS 707.79]|uniref:Putative non-ribosomal peptide synthase-like protein n=1 Tax=Aspergillus ellipticus CBS 707.79 TaxID=1448320 RepID=A0A319DBB0_9EURO|nr:putative non-ribosomal peptide synthase-like protein [Aspergillus ellipticus CBS 707.79]